MTPEQERGIDYARLFLGRIIWCRQHPDEADLPDELRTLGEWVISIDDPNILVTQLEELVLGADIAIQAVLRQIRNSGMDEDDVLSRAAMLLAG